MGHGSNARSIETVATYDPDTQEFIIHTPTETAQKFWIGNAAGKPSFIFCIRFLLSTYHPPSNNMLLVYAKWAVVFAQLFIDGVNRGVHAFIVPIRTENKGPLCKGVRIADCGHKEGKLSNTSNFMHK